MRSSLRISATMVADEFIDRYMPEANGEYVKVYLYILRHGERQVTVLELADALNCTESDIRRALAYWERLGVLEEGIEVPPQDGGAEVTDILREKKEPARKAAEAAEEAAGAAAEKEPEAADRAEKEAADRAEKEAADRTVKEAADRTGKEAADRTVEKAGVPAEDAGGSMPAESVSAPAESEGMLTGLPDARIPAQRAVYTPEQVKQLSEEEDFTQLLYVAQKYLNKVFTPRDCEVFAYMYDGLRMPAELLEYLVEYCVQGGHSSIRYLETVGLNWHEKGICTVEQAKQHTASYSNEAFAVMRAFGLSDRRPGSSEMEMIHRWFREWGFTKEMVLEACARTLAATSRPSFAYADRILMEWRKAEARTMEDVRKLDGQREKARAAETAAQGSGSGCAGGQTGGGQNDAGRAAGPAGSASGRTAGGGTGVRSVSRGAQAAPGRNRFHNFEQRDTDYDAIVLKQLKERLGKS